MCRGNWEIAALARHHISDLTTASQWRWLADQNIQEPVRLLTHLRQRLGRALIQTGQALVGANAHDPFPMPPVRPEAWKSGA